jgi:hypothetical protein
LDGDVSIVVNSRGGTTSIVSHNSDVRTRVITDDPDGLIIIGVRFVGIWGRWTDAASLQCINSTGKIRELSLLEMTVCTTMQRVDPLVKSLQ